MAAAAAAADSVQRIKAEATCSICLELLRNPVTTKCGHSFCQPCIARLCKGRVDVTCPQCRQPLPKGSLRPNRELKNIAESLRSQAAGKPTGWNTCETHQQPLQLYCKEHQSPICLVCMQAWAHRGHTMVPMEEAVQEYKGKIAEQLGVIESSCWKLHQFVKEVWKHLPENEQDEERRSMKRVCEKLVTILQVDAQQTENRPEDRSSPTPAVKSGVESSDATSASSDEEGREQGLDQASLDPEVHKISDTTEAAQCKVDVQQTRKRAEDRPSPTPAVGSGGSGTDATTESRKQEGEGAPAGDWEQPPPLDPPPPPLPQPPCLSPDTASASTPANAPTPATTPREGAAMGSRKEAAGAGQQHPGSKKSKNRKGRNKKSR